ncbi:DUF7948 domain-containing protein [Arachidicoccus ginsenosidivorans]
MYFSYYFGGKAAEGGTTNTTNYFSNTTAASFEKKTYKNMYPHINLVLYHNLYGSLEYDIIVNPTGKISDIKLQYSDATSLQLNTDKTLTTKTPYGRTNENAPVTIEKETDNSISTAFALKDNKLSFSAANYNDIIVIDLTLI